MYCSPGVRKPICQESIPSGSPVTSSARFAVQLSGRSGTTSGTSTACCASEATAAKSIGSRSIEVGRTTTRTTSATTPSDDSSASTRLVAVWFERRLALAAALRSATSSGVSARPSSATIGRPASSVLGGRELVREWGASSERLTACVTARRRRARLVEPFLRAEQPLLAALREGLAALPEGERILERGGALLEFGHDPDELVARLLVAERGDIGGAATRDSRLLQARLPV